MSVILQAILLLFFMWCWWKCIKFLMEFQTKFSDVVLELAKKYQVPIDTVEGPQQERLNNSFHVGILYRVLKSLLVGLETN